MTKQSAKNFKTFFLALFSFFVCLVAVFAAINFYVLSYAKQYVFSSTEDLPKKYTVIIPGAKVYKTTVSRVVRDRIEAALTAVQSGKAERILVSGDHGRRDYDEVNGIKRFMLQNYSVDENLIFLDHAGFSTYETMYRARDVFCVNDVVIATQEFHTVRSVYIARKLGLDAVALIAPEKQPFSRRIHAS